MQKYLKSSPDSFCPQMLHPEWKLGLPVALAVCLLPLFISLYLQEKHYSENGAHHGVFKN